MTNWEKEEKHKQSWGEKKIKAGFLPSIQKQPSSKGHGGVGVREEDALSKERTGYNTEEFCPLPNFAFS